MSHPVLALSVGLVVGALAAAGWSARTSSEYLQPAAAAVPKVATIQGNAFVPTDAQMAALSVDAVVPFDFRASRPAEGRIALDQTRVTAVFTPLSGRVARVLAAPGDAVRAGQALLTVDSSEVVQAESDLLTAVASLSSSRAQREQAETVRQRKRALVEAKAGTQQDLQQAEADLAVAQGAERGAETAVSNARNRLRILGLADRDIDAAVAGRRIEPRSVVAAPIAGTVLDRQVGVGQVVQSGGSTALFTIGDLGSVWMVAAVREIDAPAIRTGEPVDVRVLALPGRTFRGRITYVAPSVDPITRRVSVRATVANADGALKPEMFATFAIETAAPSNVPSVAESGVIYEGDAARVWRVDPDRRIELVPVRLGRTQGGRVEVLEGVRVGDRIVSAGALFIDRAVQRAND